MMNSDKLELMKSLHRLGDPRKLWHWHEGNPDYVSKLKLGPEHTEVLIEIAKQWVNTDELEEMKVLFAPIHAWRALAQLEAAEVVEPLLGMVDQLDEEEDDWFLEEFPDVFALIGPEAMPAVAAYLSDASSPYSRLSHFMC